MEIPRPPKSIAITIFCLIRTSGSSLDVKERISSYKYVEILPSLTLGRKCQNIWDNFGAIKKWSCEDTKG